MHQPRKPPNQRAERCESCCKDKGSLQHTSLDTTIRVSWHTGRVHYEKQDATTYAILSLR